MQRKFCTSVFCLLFGVLFVSPARGQAGGTWLNLANMPTARQELATAVLNGKIYVIAGFAVGGAQTNIVEVYNPKTDTWSSAHPIPITNNHNSAAVAAGKLYAFGGVSAQTFVYDEANDSWSNVASMHFSHGGTAAVGVFNDKIYIAGGIDSNGNSLTELEVYDPAANTWTILAPMSVRRNHVSGSFINGKFYAAGGRGSAAAPTALEAYNPPTNTWATLAPMPTGRSGTAAAAVNGELFVFGGETPQEVHGEVEAYNPATNTWRSLPDMPIPRHGIWASVIGYKVFLPGGAEDPAFAASNVNDVFTVDGGPVAPLEITAIERSGNDVLIRFRTLTNHTYQVERKDNLSGNWGPVSSSVTGTGGIVAVHDANAATLPKGFYRVREM